MVVVQREVRDRLTDELLFGQLEHGGTVTIGLDADALTFGFEPRAVVSVPEPA
jgi:ATP-dependent Clp protease ATP-binding subunit ClpA